MALIQITARIRGHIYPIITFACGCSTCGTHGKCEKAKQLELALEQACATGTDEMVNRAGRAYNAHFSRKRDPWKEHGLERVRYWFLTDSDRQERYCGNCTRWQPISAKKSDRCDMCGTGWNEKKKKVKVHLKKPGI